MATAASNTLSVEKGVAENSAAVAYSNPSSPVFNLPVSGQLLYTIVDQVGKVVETDKGANQVQVGKAFCLVSIS